MSTTASKAVDKLIADLSSRLEKAKRLREVIDDPEMASELEKAFANGHLETQKPTDPRRAARSSNATRLPRQGSQAWKILEYFRVQASGHGPVRDVSDAVASHVPQLGPISTVRAKTCSNE